jgi:hypothetical protein
VYTGSLKIINNILKLILYLFLYILDFESLEILSLNPPKRRGKHRRERKK